MYYTPLSNTFDLPLRQNNSNENWTAAKEKISDSERLETASHPTEFDENPNL